MRAELKGMNAHEMVSWVVSQGLEPYRGRQVRHWLFQKLASSFDEMTELSKPLRAKLNENASVNALEIIRTITSQDRTQKVLFKLSDGHFIESVLIPERDHWTLCISSQVGCAMGCRFCFTAKQGLKRNLSPSEILDQVIQVKRNMADPDRLTNIVLMGMGEPLANYDAVIKSIDNLTAQDGMNFSHRRVTLSTCGLVSKMKLLGNETTVNLAVSLNATEDKTRSFLMPVNEKYPLKSLLSACEAFPLPNRRMITFEYVLIKGVNDRDDDAQRLCRMLASLRAKINLIPLNPYPHLDMAPPSEEKIRHFQEILINHHVTAIIRKSKGADISAACGQLSGAHSGMSEGPDRDE